MSGRAHISLQMELHDTSTQEGRLLQVVVANPVDSMSGELSCSLVTVDLEGSREECEGQCESEISREGPKEEGVATHNQPTFRQRLFSNIQLGVKNLCSDLKLFFW